ncbi:MAG: hypothetical protein FH761_17945 [Firmicutes bacterium]|nr:hypothetical protein [Bacillota bacterium]
MKKLIIDPGHGGSDNGASSFGYVEKDINLVIAKRVAEILKEFNPDFTRTNDINLGSDTRTAIVRDNYEYCLSIHINAASVKDKQGIEAIHSVYNDGVLATRIAEELKESIDLPINKIFSKKNSRNEDWYYMHRETGQTTTIIVECLYLDAPIDIQHMNIEKIAQGIARGFKKFIKATEDEIVDSNDYPILKRNDNNKYVTEFQTNLYKLGYDPKGIDGNFGPGCENAVKHFQRSNKLKVDGIVGKNTWGKINELLSETTEEYEKFKHYRIDSTEIVEINPLDLKVSVQDKAANRANLKNFVTSGYQWHYDNGVTYPLGILVSEGKIIHDGQPHAYIENQPLPAGTLIIYKDGSVALKELSTIKEEKDVWFAVSGCTIIPNIKMKSAGFVGMFSDIARRTSRPLIGYNSNKDKIIIAVSHNSDIEKGQTILRNLRCDFGITLDAGGSTCLRVDGEDYFTTSRRLYSLITW